MLFDTLKRAILRGNYVNKEEMAEKLSILYSAGKITDEPYIYLLVSLVRNFLQLACLAYL